MSHHRARDRIQAKGTFTRAFRGFSATLSKAQRSALLADPNVTEVVPDELIHLTSQTTPTGVSRIGARLSPVAKINGLDERVDADVAIVDTGVSYHPDLNVAGGYNCTTCEPRQRGATRTATARTSPARSRRSTTRSASSGSRRAPGSGPCGSSTRTATGCCRGTSAASTGSSPSATRTTRRRPLIEAANMSVAKAGADDGECGVNNRDILHQAICRLVAGGTTVVAAAANDHASASKRVPAAYNEVITVSALADTDGKRGGLGGNRCFSWGGYDKDDTFADFSNYGSDVDLIAPGKCIWSTKPGNSYQYMSGTSMAAPAVTGAVALYKSSRPNATPAEVKEALQYLGTYDWKTSTDPDAYHEKLLDVSRLGPLGTFSLDTSALGYTNSHGGTSLIPVAIDRSSTFFERVRFSITSLPSGWTAAHRVGQPARLDRGQDDHHRACPRSGPGRDVSHRDLGHEHGPDRHRQRHRRRRQRQAERRRPVRRHPSRHPRHVLGARHARLAVRLRPHLLGRQVRGRDASRRAVPGPDMPAPRPPPDR